MLHVKRNITKGKEITNKKLKRVARGVKMIGIMIMVIYAVV